MTQTLTLYQVDAFTDHPFGGNPAAVCPLEAWLEDDLMQAIALENNLSETAFFVPEGEGFHLRWFTPTVEVDLCGHATLASAYVIAEHLEPGRQVMDFRTMSGPLQVTRQGERFALDLPSLPGAVVDQPELAAIIGVEPLEVRRATKTLALLRDEAAVRAAQPDMTALLTLPGDGLIITAPGDEVDFVSRYFAPQAGIPEDPVTGSAHSTLAPYWAERLGQNKMVAKQVSARGGDLEVELRGDRVILLGQVTPYLTGSIRV